MAKATKKGIGESPAQHTERLLNAKTPEAFKDAMDKVKADKSLGKDGVAKVANDYANRPAGVTYERKFSSQKNVHDRIEDVFKERHEAGSKKEIIKRLSTFPDQKPTTKPASSSKPATKTEKAPKVAQSKGEASGSKKNASVSSEAKGEAGSKMAPSAVEKGGPAPKSSAAADLRAKLDAKLAAKRTEVDTSKPTTPIEEINHKLSSQIGKVDEKIVNIKGIGDVKLKLSQQPGTKMVKIDATNAKTGEYIGHGGKIAGDEIQHGKASIGGINVDPKYRSKGVASAIYDYADHVAEKAGTKIVPTDFRTGDGSAFWKKRDPAALAKAESAFKEYEAKQASAKGAPTTKTASAPAAEAASKGPHSVWGDNARAAALKAQGKAAAGESLLAKAGKGIKGKLGGTLGLGLALGTTAYAMKQALSTAPAEASTKELTTRVASAAKESLAGQGKELAKWGGAGVVGNFLAKQLASKGLATAARIAGHAVPGVGMALTAAEVGKALYDNYEGVGQAKGMGRGGVKTNMAPTKAGDVSKPRGTTQAPKQSAAAKTHNMIAQSLMRQRAAMQAQKASATHAPAPSTASTLSPSQSLSQRRSAAAKAGPTGQRPGWSQAARTAALAARMAKATPK